MTEFKTKTVCFAQYPTESMRNCWPGPAVRGRRVIRLLTHENFDGDVLRGLLRRTPDLDVVRVRDVGLAETPDPMAKRWQERIIRFVLDTFSSPGN